MTTPLFFISLIGFIVLINGYFMLANRYNIIDKPNERSSHTVITIRGGGIIFYFAGLAFVIMNPDAYFFGIGLTLMAFISFLDDIRSVSNIIRIVIHFISISCLFVGWGMFSQEWYMWLIPVIIVAIGTINSSNFMDGINGMTGLYGLVFFSSALLYNEFFKHFINSDFLLFSIIALLVFNFYNFRTKARCFAGDVGSVSLAFMFLYVLGTWMLVEQSIFVILFLTVYGVDTVFTIVQRLYQKENIFEAHRKHLYQYLVHKSKMPHLVVSTIYAVIQLSINGLLILVIYMNINQWMVAGLLLFAISVVYIAVKYRLENR